MENGASIKKKSQTSRPAVQINLTTLTHLYETSQIKVGNNNVTQYKSHNYRPLIKFNEKKARSKQYI